MRKRSISMEMRTAAKSTALNIREYIRLFKPRETGLLVFIGFCTVVVAARGLPPAIDLVLALTAITVGSGAVNGLTNYLDREVDGRMERTRRRPLPSSTIQPPEKALVICLVLLAIALALAWFLNPWCFVAGSVGTLAAVVMRKTVLCPFLGAISGCAPVVIAWFAIRPDFTLELLVLCSLVSIWIPLHVWSVMLANRDDYIQGGVKYFPLSRETRESVKVLLLLSLPLAGASIAVYFTSNLGWLYLITAAVLGMAVLYTSLCLVISATSRDAWKVYKLSAFPYLGLIFLAMCLDSWFVAGR